MSKRDSTLTQERLKQALRYDPETGIFTRIRNGRRAGSFHIVRKYWYVGIGYTIYSAHRLAWLYMTGEWPKHDIDHLDGDGDNNRWSNLRDAPTIVNCENRRVAQKNNLSGLMGVTQNGVGWTARITIKKRTVYLGYFETKEEAHSAYLLAKRENHEGCTI